MEPGAERVPGPRPERGAGRIAECGSRNLAAAGVEDRTGSRTEDRGGPDADARRSFGAYLASLAISRALTLRRSIVRRSQHERKAGLPRAMATAGPGVLEGEGLPDERTVTAESDAMVATARASEDGTFEIPRLLPGTYVVSAQMPLSGEGGGRARVVVPDSGKMVEVVIGGAEEGAAETSGAPGAADDREAVFEKLRKEIEEKQREAVRAGRRSGVIVIGGREARPGEIPDASPATKGRAAKPGAVKGRPGK
jgi:hypothetical protein